MFAALQGRAWGRARGIPSLFVLTIRTGKVTPSTWPPPLRPRRKELAHRGRDHLPGEPPAFRGPFHFLPASPLRTSTTNVRRANQLQKRGPERSGTPTLDPRQPAVARPARAGRAPSPATAPQAAAPRLTRPGPLPPARRPAAASARTPRPLTALPGRQPPPSRGLTCCPPPWPRPSPVSTRSRAGGRRRRGSGDARREEPGAEQPLG